ncbi:MAG: hypothetical protein K8S20_01410 [Chloroflexi bacterium]|nr:hypothetical protein [Chloroflexota bacterium]
MPISARHTDLFHNSDTSDKILLFQQLLESQDLTAMEALALLNTIHQELQQSEGHQPEVYVRYARMMELFRKRMPELQEEVTRKWSELQFILKARESKGEILADDPELVEKEQKGRLDYKSSGRVPPGHQPRPLSEKTGRPIRQDNGDVITGGAETEEEGMEQDAEETEVDKEGNVIEKEREEIKEQESDDEEQDEEENINEKEDIESEKEEEPESEPDEKKNEQDELEIEEKEIEVGEAETEQEVEEQVEEKEVELKSETQNRESEVSISEEGIEKEISPEEEGVHLAGEAAEAAAEQEQHGSEPPLELDEEEPPMESTGG